MKRVVFSIDVEDWYHLDYFDKRECEIDNSLLDGLDVYVRMLERFDVPSSFFVLGEIAASRLGFFKDLVRLGHDVGSHGWDHIRPMSLTLDQFKDDLKHSYDVMKTINGNRGFGYRAPCFSLDRERLDLVREAGFAYDSSRIDFGHHPLYGSIDMDGFDKVSSFVYQDGDFIEFEATTLPVMGRNLPISGGGYLRLLPWFLMKTMISRHLKTSDLYVLYVHPFELSNLQTPVIPESTTSLTKFRFSHGRQTVAEKIARLVDLLHNNDYIFTTFSSIQKEMSAECFS